MISAFLNTEVTARITTRLRPISRAPQRLLPAGLAYFSNPNFLFRAARLILTLLVTFWVIHTKAGQLGSTLRVQQIYDADGQRVGKRVIKFNSETGATFTNEERYLLEALNPTGQAQVAGVLSAEAEQWKVTQRSLHGNGPIGIAALPTKDTTGQEPSLKTHYFLTDGYGSVRRELIGMEHDQPATIYTAWGEALASEGSSTSSEINRGFAGEIWDRELGMHELRARQYCPKTGRFWTLDNFEGAPDNPVSLHKFIYASDDPVNNSDPSGHFTVAQVGAAMGMSSAVGGLSGAVYGGIKHGVEGSLQYGLAGAGMGPLLTAGIMTGGSATAGLLGVSEATGVLLLGSAVNVYGIGASATELIHAETTRERTAALFSLGMGILGQGSVTRGYMSIRAGRGTFQNLNPNATPEETAAGKLAADYFGADIVAQAPQGRRGATTADYRIVLRGGTLELKNVTSSQSFDSITATISHAQGENVMIIVKPGQLSPAELGRLSGRLFSPRSPSNKQSVTVIEERPSGYQVIFHDARRQ